MTAFEKIISTLQPVKVISKEIDYKDYIALDLSVNNTALKNYKLETAEDYAVYIQNYLDENNAKIAFGGYQETRNLYKRSSVFNDKNSEERNIHIGLDLWINEQAAVYAAFEGTIHSLQNNTALGDYGPTIILQHEINGFKFHTLYGHLSLESLSGKKVGDSFIQGETIANLGLPPINGDYAPHLHFQIIIDMETKTGDYPGVCNLKDLEFYEENCPDPNVLLKIEL